MPSEVANGTPFNKKLHLISRSAQGTIPKFTSAKQVNLNVELNRSVSRRVAGMTKVPREALSISHTSTGLLMDTSLHYRKGQYHLESSYSHFAFLAVMLVVGGVCVFWPVTIVTPQGIDLRYVFAVMFVWGGLCGLIPYFLRNRFGIYVTIDPSVGLLRIHPKGDRPSIANLVLDPIAEMVLSASSGKRIEIPFVDVIELQLVGDGPYQANIVYRTGDEIHRFNIAQHAAKKRVKKLLNSIARVGSFEVVEV